MSADLKRLSKACLASANEALPDGASDKSDKALLALLCAETLTALEAECDSDDDDDVRRDVKRVRKMLRRLAPAESAEAAVAAPSATADPNAPDLGQYASAEVFEGDKRKVGKFARLMGGAKHAGESSTHGTMAASRGDVKQRERDMAEQFNQATKHKGKKGLGL
jgi:hypothetical protein